MAKLKELKKPKAGKKAEVTKYQVQKSSSASKKSEKKNAKRDTEEGNAEDYADPEILSVNVKEVRKNKRKHSVEASDLADGAGEFALTLGGTKSKVKEARKNKKKKHDSLNDESKLAESKTDDIDQSSTREDKLPRGTSKVKEVRKNKKKHVLPKGSNDKSELANELAESKTDNGDQISTAEGNFSRGTTAKLNKARKSKKKDHILPKGDSVSVQIDEEPYDIYQLSSGEEDCSRGMKKWIKEYHLDRTGLEVLQQKIDDFITSFEEQEEQARKDTEAKIAEDGWTVVVHRKGGKKTSDPESGVVVGSVSQGAVLHKMEKKKHMEVGPDFYRFQRREAQRSEVMKLQSKFEEDKKRIHQLRAARKFKPY